MARPGEASPTDFLNPEEDMGERDPQLGTEERSEGGPGDHLESQPGGAQVGEPTEEQQAGHGAQGDGPAVLVVVENPEESEGQPTEDEQLLGTTGGSTISGPDLVDLAV